MDLIPKLGLFLQCFFINNNCVMNNLRMMVAIVRFEGQSSVSWSKGVIFKCRTYWMADFQIL
jgi:hypothetical protein